MKKKGTEPQGDYNIRIDKYRIVAENTGISFKIEGHVDGDITLKYEIEKLLAEKKRTLLVFPGAKLWGKFAEATQQQKYYLAMKIREEIKEKVPVLLRSQGVRIKGYNHGMWLEQ